MRRCNNAEMSGMPSDCEDGTWFWSELRQSLSLLGWGLAVTVIPCMSFSYGGSRFAPQMVVAPVLAIAGLRRLPLERTTSDLQQRRRALLVLAVVVLGASVLALYPPLGGVTSAAAWLAAVTFLVLLCSLLSRLTSFLDAPQFRLEWQRLTKVALLIAAASFTTAAVFVILVATGVVSSRNVVINSDTSVAVSVLVASTALVSLCLFLAVVGLLARAWSHTSRWVRRHAGRSEPGRPSTAPGRTRAYSAHPGRTPGERALPGSLGPG